MNMNPEVRAYLSEIGRKGGKAATNQSEAGRAAWAHKSPAERSAELKKRAKKRTKTRESKMAEWAAMTPAEQRADIKARKGSR